MWTLMRSRRLPGYEGGYFSWVEQVTAKCCLLCARKASIPTPTSALSGVTFAKQVREMYAEELMELEHFEASKCRMQMSSSNVLGNLSNCLVIPLDITVCLKNGRKELTCEVFRLRTGQDAAKRMLVTPHPLNPSATRLIGPFFLSDSFSLLGNVRTKLSDRADRADRASRAYYGSI
ncbi:hypothetical protein VTL71DRAFT_2013 [Oculimacula yallundae]|uniref:Uncharacterized protein n=1 Tax=Oculimacula yallundae TaxID=86028 RepID=A0ABR4CC99_9HELO